MTTTPEEQHAGPPPAGAHLYEPDATTEDVVSPLTPSMSRAARPPRDLPRWVRWTVLPLLVLVPVGYVIVAARQSRVAGEDKQQEAAVRHLANGYPTGLQKRIYQIPMKKGVYEGGVLETNSWDVSVLYVRFTTTAGGLDTFLADVGTSRYALHQGTAAINAKQAKAAGWDFTKRHAWSGITMHQVGDKPDHDISVDLTYPDAPVVYAVSTVNFQHGFGGG